MTEKILHLEHIDPLEICGINNVRLNLIKKAFPKIHLVARGTELKIIGEPNEIESFECKFKQILNYIDTHNTISDEHLSKILEQNADSKEDILLSNTDIIVFGNNGKPIKARTPNQEQLVQQSLNNDLIFALGPAGTGKTYTAIALAVRALSNREVKRIILSRPAVEAGERLGFLPGDLKEKIDPYLQPLYDALYDMIPAKKLENFLNEGIIQIAPLAFMRGRTLENAFVILDEAQNTTLNQMKMFLTRMGKNSQFVVTGDITQIDLPKVSDSGLVQSLKILKDINGIGIVELTEKDIVRHPLVKKIVKSYDKLNNNKKEKK